MRIYSKLQNWGILLLLVALSTGCASDDDNTGGGNDNAVQEVTLSGINNTQWSYFSFSTGEIIGTSALGNTEEDAAWKVRSDWDIALCGSYIRTNGGTSGDGNGAIQYLENSTFETVTAADAGEFLFDSMQKE